MSSEIIEKETIKIESESVSASQAFKGLLPFLKSHRFGLIFCLVLLSAATVLSLVWPILLKRALDVNIKNGDLNGLIFTVAGIALIQVATVILQYIQRIKLEMIGQDVMVDLKSKLFDHLLSLDISFFDKNPVGRLMSRIESDTESLRMLFTNAIVLLIGDLILIVGVFGVMYYYSWRLASILLCMIPVVVFLTYIFQKQTASRFFEIRKKTADITASLTEFLQGISIVQIFHRGEYARERVNHANALKFKDASYAEIVVCLFFNSIFFLQYIMIATTLYFGAIWIGSGVITVGIISMFLVLIWRVFEPLYRLSDQLATIQKSFAGAKRIFALLSNESKLIDAAVPVRWKKLEKGIKFENVWFSYDNDGNYVLKNVSFDIPLGKRVALAGVTGGGKSTVINLMLRFYDPQRGRITIDGIDIREISQADIRQRFALVLQDIILFPGDFNSNIALESNDISDSSIVSASTTVDADKFIRRLPEGYKTQISEKGANLSRGERQLLSFARALVINPDVLVLDEATSSVDPETERSIQSSLKKMMEGRTSLVIAHRLSTILDVDEILVIRKGEIVEKGTHTELILQNGYYSKLFHLQFKNRNGVANYA